MYSLVSLAVVCLLFVVCCCSRKVAVTLSFNNFSDFAQIVINLYTFRIVRALRVQLNQNRGKIFSSVTSRIGKPGKGENSQKTLHFLPFSEEIQMFSLR